jgi:hypothetical protein
MNNLRSSSSRSQMSSKSDNTVNKEEVSLTNFSLENNWQDWKLPLVPQNKIYKKTTFSNHYISLKLHNKNCRKNLLFKTKF